MKTVLVTGASGFIGRHCLPFLKEYGYNIHAISSQKSGRDESGVIWHKVDLLHESTKNLLDKVRPTHLLHAAWYTAHGVYWNSEKNLDWLKLSEELLNNFQLSGGLRFLNVGTCAEYTWPGKCVEGITEENPSTLYGKSKKEFSDRVLKFNEFPSQLSTASGRIFFLYGPHESSKRLVPSVIENLLSEESPKCTDGMQLRDFMYVEDAALALVTLLNSSVKGIVNIASGSPVTLKSLISIISSVLNSQTEVYFNAIMRSQDDPDILTASVKRLNEEVDFQPNYSLEVGLKITADFIRKTLEQKHAALK